MYLGQEQARPAKGKMSLAQKAYETIRSEIIKARLKPNDILTESDLAQRLGISKTPVRDALQALVKERLIDVIPRKGYVVRSVGLGDVKEVLQLRLIIEPALAATAARHMTDQDFKELSRLLSIQRHETGTEALTNAARDFHLKIIDVSQNIRAEAILLPLFDETTRIHHLVPLTAEFLHSDDEIHGHEELLNAFLRKDPEAASKAMHDHIVEVRDTMLRGLLDG